ncbi:NF-kappa-B inhibitor zeta isoform X2 [Danio rerio]|uniref:NF-kappa-B inhibitor zeta isoform X2 n=1 Tax=Danio rerio TaxID=7955 RepID=A0AC58JFW2_DANRE|nr:NF-kappa-B inhibitor zeta isoform X2 [Danio rerio]|eukprot:XP_021331587.1 NF-kappa-B inhibitor zeta isoform X2 [Danio rerio]
MTSRTFKTPSGAPVRHSEQQQQQQQKMIIDRVSDGFSGLLDRDADLISPVQLWGFPGCSSPTEPLLSPGEPSSDSEHSWSDASVEAEGTRRSRYQGVRVKNTVKELIMRRKHLHTQVQQQQFAVDDECAVLQSRKRTAESVCFSAVKRARATDGYTPMECVSSDCDLLEDLGVFLAPPLSVGSVMESVCADAPPLYMQNTLPAVQNTLPAAPPVSFFQWQIQQEDEKLSALSPAELMSRDEDGDTFLHIAVAQGRRALAFVLASRMAELGVLDLKEHNQQSALQVCVAADQHLIAQDLLSLGADPNTFDRWGRSPLHVCAEKGHSATLQAIQRCVQQSGRSLSLEMVNYEGLTPLHTAVLAHNAVLQELSGHVTQDVTLLQKRKKLAECIATLLQMGAALGTQDCKSGRTALHMAAEQVNVELLRLFLDQPDCCSVINTRAFSGNTALHMASALQGRDAQLEAVRLLLRRGADPSARNLENEQPAQLVNEGPLGDQVRRVLKGKSAPLRP